VGEVEVLLGSTIREFMRGKSYLAEEAEGWTSDLSARLNALVKQLNFPRYKLVTFVTLGENNGGGVHMGLKTLWDSETDLFATHTYMTVRPFILSNVVPDHRPFSLGFNPQFQ
jgi:hypothetical protein